MVQIHTSPYNSKACACACTLMHMSMCACSRFAVPVTSCVWEGGATSVHPLDTASLAFLSSLTSLSSLAPLNSLATPGRIRQSASQVRGVPAATPPAATPPAGPVPAPGGGALLLR